MFLRFIGQRSLVGNGIYDRIEQMLFAALTVLLTPIKMLAS